MASDLEAVEKEAFHKDETVHELNLSEVRALLAQHIALDRNLSSVCSDPRLGTSSHAGRPPRGLKRTLGGLGHD